MGLHAATSKALYILQKAANGYSLMVKWDANTDDPRVGFKNIVDFDKLIAEVEKRVDLNDTLLLFTADHSFGLPVAGGQRGDDVLEGYDAWEAGDSDGDVGRLKNVLVNDYHTAEYVTTLAIDAGADHCRGFFLTPPLFH